MMTRIVAPSRLHFGLFHVPPAGEHRAGERAFGGIGLMIERPDLVVTIKAAESWQFEGPLASRAQQFAMLFMQSLAEEERQAFQVLIERCPNEHTGLGVGTQLGMSVARALAVRTGHADLSAPELAVRVGRGQRSAVGVYGFAKGGLVVEMGKRAGEAISPLLSQGDLPAPWRVVIFLPPAPPPWYGTREQLAFSRAGEGKGEVLEKIAQSTLIPAARAGDLETFGAALTEFNRLAGEPFASSQGGPYASSTVCELIDELRRLGIRGVGQSSWGPTVFAIVADDEKATTLVKRFQSRVPVFVTKISSGHRLETR
jgi:beta-RFAP synthase